MEVAILVVAAVGTAITAVAFALGERRRRPQLDVAFVPTTFSRGDGELLFVLRLTARDVSLGRVDIFPIIFAPGFTLDARSNLGPITLAAWAHRDITVRFRTPRPVDLPSNSVRIVFSAPIGAAVVYGRRQVKTKVYPGSGDVQLNLLVGFRRALRRGLPAASPATSDSSF